MGTIYKITNLINGKCYIGQTIQKVNRRWKDHKSSKNGMIINKAIRKYGKENFSFEVLEDNILQENLSSRELHYITLYKSFNRKYGYNNCDVVEGKIYHSIASRKRQSLKMKERHDKGLMKNVCRKNGLKQRGRKFNGKSKYLGVSPNKSGKYLYFRAYTSLNGKPQRLGNFKSEIEAAKAYDLFVKNHFGSDAKTNFK